MIRIFLSGCNGRMGHQISDIVRDTEDMTIVAGSDIKQDTPYGYPVYSVPLQCSEDFDVLIDFSSPAALPALIDLIRQKKCPAVICTTGLTDELKDQLAELADSAPLFISANMSLGINIMVNLARQAARLLYPEFNIEIIEAHHNQKVDAPSGTALLLADQIKDSLAQQVEYVYDRSPVRRKRGQQEIGIHAIRGGNIVGEHTVLYAGPEEVLEIRHRAQSRAVFARGALAAARFMTGKPAGMYNMEQLIDQ